MYIYIYMYICTYLAGNIYILLFKISIELYIPCYNHPFMTVITHDLSIIMNTWPLT